MKPKHLNLDLPSTTVKRRIVLKKKYFLNKTYKDFYIQILNNLLPENRQGKIIELGSGAGFIKEIIPNTITSDVLKIPGVDKVFSATKLPFKDRSLNAIVMFDVFHHINDIEKFLNEAQRCLKPNGQIIMVEPANTLFSKIVYKYLHHEAYDPKGDWKFKTSGPLSGANLALAWIVCIKDKKLFVKKFPKFKIKSITAHTPFRFILSGGFSHKQMLPDFTYSLILEFEKIISRLNPYLGLFYTINIVKKK